MNVRLRHLLLADWQLKLLSIVVALALWAYARGDKALTLTLDVPLEMFNQPRALVFARRPPGTIEVRLAVRRDVITRLRPKSILAVVNLSRVKRGRMDIKLSPENIVRPEGVEVLDIAPGRLILEFKPAGRKEE